MIRGIEMPQSSVTDMTLQRGHEPMGRTHMDSRYNFDQLDTPATLSGLHFICLNS